MINERYLALFQNEAEVKKLTKRIWDEGCVALPDFFDQATLDELTRYSASLDEGVRPSIVRKSGTPAMNVARSAEFMQVFDAIHKARCEIQDVAYRPLDPTQQAVSLPIKRVEDGDETTPFHFDHSYVNAVLALKMPAKDEGNLLIYRNFRTRIKPLTFSKVLSRLLRHSALLRGVVRPKEVSYREGALHIFFGDITFHGVPAISNGERVTFTINASRVVQAPNAPEIAVAA